MVVPSFSALFARPPGGLESSVHQLRDEGPTLAPMGRYKVGKDLLFLGRLRATFSFHLNCIVGIYC